MIYQGARTKARINKRNLFNIKTKKSNHPPYPDNMIGIGNELIGYNAKYDMNKHFKSNSETAHNIFLKEQNCLANENSENVYSNKVSLKNRITSQDEINNDNLIIFGNDFNTAKYSQSPFLNKMTNFKQKGSGKEPKIINIENTKGHKSRNSMLPKSYTEFSSNQRREQETYSNRHRAKMNQIPEEKIRRKEGEFKLNNPYSNFAEIENEVVTAYGNDANNVNQNIIFKNLEQHNKIKIESDKKRAPTDTTRSKTGIDASNDSNNTSKKGQLISEEK